MQIARVPISFRLAFGLAGAMGFFVLMEHFPAWQPLFEPVNQSLARSAEQVLRYMEVPVARSGAVLAHPDGFSYRITYVCSGLRPFVLIAVTLLLVPGSWRSRITGMCVALVGIEALNLLRLVHLYLAGSADANAFFVAHRITWNIIAIVAVIAFLIAWLGVAGRHGSGLVRNGRADHAFR